MTKASDPGLQIDLFGNSLEPEAPKATKTPVVESPKVEQAKLISQEIRTKAVSRLSESTTVFRGGADSLLTDLRETSASHMDSREFLREVEVQVRKSQTAAPVAIPVPQATIAIEVSETVEEIILPQAPTIFSVSDIALALKETLNSNFSEIIVQGEIADFKGIHRSGHLYFALKDEKSQIRAVMWKGALQKLPFEIKGGLEVLCTARVDFYGGSGSLQLVVERMEPVGIGALQLRFEQLKEKLKSEGLFEVARKRKIKSLNWRVGIITSRSTAALQDMLKIFRLRFPLVEIFIFHAAVQGERAANEIVQALRAANRFSLSCEKPLDLLIVGRGGGSYEDLFCFNDEALAREIAASALPVISAIGHEIDITIADMVADKRASTPTHAAEECVPDRADWLERLAELSKNFERQILDAIHDHQIQIDTFFNRLSAAAPQKRLQDQKLKLQSCEHRLNQAMKVLLEERRKKIQSLASIYDALSPLKVFERGYSIVKNAQGAVIKSVKELRIDDVVETRLRDGNFKSKVLA